LVAWSTAELSFEDPEVSANVVFGRKVEGSKEQREQLKGLVEKMVDDSSPYGAAGLHYIHDVIDPRKTRDFLIKALEIDQDSRTGGISQRELANWPIKF